MLRQNYNHDGMEFSVNIDGRDIPFNEWIETDDIIYYQPLAALVDNGEATISGCRCTVPYANLYILDQDERSILGVPQTYDKAMRIRGEGMLNSQDFQYKIELLSHIPDGDILTYERRDNIVSTKDEKFLLSKDQYQLANLVEAFNATPPENKTTDFNLRHFSEIKSLAIKADCEMDSYLQNENVYVPDQIKLKVGRDEDGFCLEPAINIEENGKFQHTFDRIRKVQGAYPIERDNGERVRVVLNPKQKDSLTRVKAGGKHMTREEIQEIVEHPTEHFDPDVLDLTELYSERVIEIGVYKPKFYPFICPYKSCWIAGAMVETPQNGTTKLTIGNESDLESLKAAILEAAQGQKGIVEYDDAHIDIDDARFLAETASRQLASPEQPIEPGAEQKDDGRKVLIIKDNAEETDFAVKKEDIEKSDKYTLYKDMFLNAAFQLKPHQEEGVAWLQHLYQCKASGCLMADDMGLGKTLQILYFIDWHSRKYPNHKPYLIVAPVSLLENWENEYNRFFASPRLNITRLTSKNVPRQFDKTIVEKMQDLQIILTNYESLRISQLNFCAVDFDIIALDEAQKIKSPGTLVTNAAKALKGKFKIAMTGTPVENTLLDLWCIMDFCVPGLLGNAKAFAAKYQNPLKDEDTDITALGNEIHDKMGIYFMRRLKKDAAEGLPEKTEIRQEAEMPAVQLETYKHAVNEYAAGMKDNMLQTIMDIRNISEHPYLYDHSLSQRPIYEIADTSARLQAMIPSLDSIKTKEEKAIIFAERKEIQKMLWRICHERYGIAAKIINGDTPSTAAGQDRSKLSRQASIDEFQAVEGFNIIIMSPLAAGMGLNVTAANHVIHYSRHWNPAKENQATDRAYRIGQEKEVFVYYPMAVSKDFKSFDKTLDELLSRKTSLASSTIFPTERIEVKPDELGQTLLGI